MLGHTLFLELSRKKEFDIWGTVRSSEGIGKWFGPELISKIIIGVEADDFVSLRKTILDHSPDLLINCIGIIKQIPLANDSIASISINALFPHQLARLCRESGSRLIHVSTDCVFNGQKGNYSEKDASDATDLYGKTKFLGEVVYPHCVTLRTSIIGHELKGKYGLIEWFLSQKGRIRGYTNAIFSGFPTVELSRIIGDFIIPDESLSGLYQVSSEPISKFDLLGLVSKRYGKEIEIEPYDEVRENRSLDSSLFRERTGYHPPPWEKLIDDMYRRYSASASYQRS